MEIEAHLPSAITQARVSHTLVTVLPDITQTITHAWRAMPAVLERIFALLRPLTGMYTSVVAVEVHGGPRPKKRKDPAQSTAQPEDEQSAEEEEPGAAAQAEPEAQTEGQTNLPKPKGLKGHPHLHLLIYYPTSTNPALDPSHVKRILLTEFPKGDVNQVHLRRGQGNDRKRQVGAMKYVLKGTGCPVMSQAWALIHPGRPTPLPTFVPGELFARGLPAGIRWIAMMKTLAAITTSEVELDESPAPDVFEGAPKRSAATDALIFIAQRVGQLGYRIRGSATWCQLQEGTSHTWVECFDHAGLIHVLSKDPDLLDLLVRFQTRLPDWFLFDAFARIPTEQAFRYIELQDCVYDVRTGAYIGKSSFTGTCFRYYAITQQHSLDTEPREWLKLIDQHYPASDVAERAAFLRKMARLLRPRRPKEPILFIVGVRGSGKSTAICWLIELYPPAAIGTINDSIAPLSQIEGRTVLVCDEFSTSKISRTNLLLLTDGSTGLNVRQMGHDAKFITKVDLPQVFTANIGHEPSYKNDKDPDAVNVRFRFFYWRKEILSPDWDAADRIRAETPLIVFYLNRLLNENDQQ